MKLKFKVQAYQTIAVESVVDCFTGQPLVAGGFRNADLQLMETQLTRNILEVQKRQNLPLSDRLASSKECTINLDVEMETGTGKTYCYIKTIFEMNKRYGWNKFIIMVPSIAIREGIYKSFEITAEHFSESYNKKARVFIYNSKQLHHLESFSSDAGINVMIINIQAFNAKGADNRRIYDDLDDFQSRRPIDVIAGNRPILILDEPQKMEGKATTEALSKFRPLMILRYSATHKTTYNKVHRLDALDAYNQKLVKKISVRGITVNGLSGTNAFLFLESIEVSKQAPVARIEMEVKLKGGVIKRMVKSLGNGDDLFDISNSLDQYKGFIISQIDANQHTVEFKNGVTMAVGEAMGDVTEAAIRRIQIRETIMAHLEKEKQLFADGIKVLSLFFIDEVVKYRDYSKEDEKGDYARIFEEEYEMLKNEVLSEPAYGDHEKAYHEHLQKIEVSSTHDGYFSIDKKTRHLTDPSMPLRGEGAGLSDDVDAYDLILKNKERLLSFQEPVRFIFSHSALREGWDNPNVFVMCMLKHSDNTISRRQEVGRGLRLCVNQAGDRIDDHTIVHDINVLTVIASESYKDFVGNLQQEISEALSACRRPLIDGVFSDAQLPEVGDDRKPKTNPLNEENSNRKEFRELWNRNKRRAEYSVRFDSAELVRNCINTLNADLRVIPLQYTIQSGIQGGEITDVQLKLGDGFEVKQATTNTLHTSTNSAVKYDLLGRIAQNVQLTRKTVAEILTGIEPVIFDQFKNNPEHFIEEASRLIHSITFHAKNNHK
jgi:type III restriction enzyme